MAQTRKYDRRNRSESRESRDRRGRRSRQRRKKPKRKRIVIAVILIAVLVVGILVLTNSKTQKKIGSALYPIKYSEYVDKASADYNVEKELVYAMIRTESHFDKDAVSSAGAIGLMQLTNETYDWLCRLRDISYVDDGLLEPSINIDFGTYFISYLFKEFGDERLVIAAYNAGPDNVKSWLKNPDYSSDGVTLENIPYEETKNHVDRVLDAKEKYKKIYFS